MNPDTIHEVQLPLVRKIEDLLSRPSIPVGRQLIDQTFNKRRDKQMADDLSTAMLYLLYTNKVKREQTEDGVPKFWLSSRDTPTDVDGKEIPLVGGLSRQFHYRLIDGNQCVETNVVGVGDSVVKRAPPPIKTMMPVPQNKETQDQLAAVMLQTGTHDQVREALGYASRPTLVEEMRAAAAAVDEEEEDGSGQDDEDTPPSSPPVIADPANFLHARMSALEGYRLDDQLVIAVSFWQKPVKEEELIEFFMTKLMAKLGTLKLRLAHVVKVRQELTRTERDGGVYYSVGPKTATLTPRPKTAAYKPRTPQRAVELPSAPPAGAAVSIVSDATRNVEELLQPTVSIMSTPTDYPLVAPTDKAIELTEDSKVTYTVDDTGAMSINVSGVSVLRFTSGAAAKLVQFSSNVRRLYDL